MLNLIRVLLLIYKKVKNVYIITSLSELASLSNSSASALLHKPYNLTLYNVVRVGCIITLRCHEGQQEKIISCFTGTLLLCLTSGSIRIWCSFHSPRIPPLWRSTLPVTPRCYAQPWNSHLSNRALRNNDYS